MRSLRQIGVDGLPGGSLQSHTVRAADTLQSIAQVYFGSPAYWYLIADANGLSGTERLAEGTTLAIPNKVANSANTADTFKVYNESEIIGSTSPEIRTVAKKKKWYQKLIQILIIVIMIVAVIVTAGAALAIAGAATPGLLAIGASLATSLGAVGLTGVAAVAAAAGIGAAVYATANILTQGLAIAAGLQDGFSWKQVGKAAVTGAVTGAAAFLAAPAAGANAFSWGNVAQQVAIEGGKQMLLNDGKITSVAGLLGAAVSAGALGQMGAFGTALANNSRTLTAGLSLLENKLRGRGDNAMDWVGLATAAVFDSGSKRDAADARAQGATPEQAAQAAQNSSSGKYTTATGELNWTTVAAKAIGTLVIADRRGEDAALNYLGSAVGDYAVEAGGKYLHSIYACRISTQALQPAPS